jgi:hypothetical protein
MVSTWAARRYSCISKYERASSSSSQSSATCIGDGDASAGSPWSCSAAHRAAVNNPRLRKSSVAVLSSALIAAESMWA